MNDKIVSAQGENLSLVNVKGSKLNALSVYGKSTQSGTPSPDNPVPIVSAGDSGEINVTVGGKNLIPFPYLSPLGGAGTVYEVDGVTYTVQADGGIKCVGTPTSKFGPTLCRIRFSEESLKANDSESVTNGKVTLSGGPLYFDSNNNTTFIYWASRVDTPVDMTIYPQVEYGTVATAYEPYKTPQTLTLSTPGGLPGIPVTSGGNYTDENGQQWIVDVKDYGTGKYTQNIGQIASYNGEGVGDVWMSSTGQLTTGANVIYQLATPIVTDISAEEIAAYQVLHTYSPNTTVSNDAEAWMKVGYREWRR